MAILSLENRLTKLFSLWTLGLTLSLLCLPLPLQAGALALNQAHRAVWKIQLKREAVDRLYGNRMGTTFAVGMDSSGETNHFITNAHVLYALFYMGASRSDIVLSQKGHRKTLGIRQIVALSGTYDLALVKTTESVTDYVILADTFSTQKEHSIIGYPGGSFNRLRQTGISMYKDSLSFMFSVNQMGVKGLSGGPVLNQYGEVVGVNHSARDNMIYGVKLEHVARIVDNGITCSQSFSLESCVREDTERVKELARHRNNEVAQFQIGRHDPYIKTNLEMQNTMLIRSAHAGFPPAKYTLAVRHYNGDRNFRRDRKRAFREFRETARKPFNYVFAQDFTAVLYAHGTGTPQNWKNSVYWFERAAQQGHAPAQYELAHLLTTVGLGIPQDRERAMNLVEKAADQGHEQARNFLGRP